MTIFVNNKNTFDTATKTANKSIGFDPKAINLILQLFCSFCSYLRKGQLNVILHFSQFGIHFDSFGHCYGLNYKTSIFIQIAKM